MDHKITRKAIELLIESIMEMDVEQQWTLFAMEPSCDPDLGSVEGWLEIKGFILHASAPEDDPAAITIVIIHTPRS